MKLKTQYDAQFMEVANLPPFHEFISRVTEMYAHNIIHYIDANPTMDEAFHEVLTDMIDEVLVTQQREEENAKVANPK